MNITFDPDGLQVRRKTFSKHDSFRNARAENFGFKDVRMLDGNIGYLSLTKFMIQPRGETATAVMNRILFTIRH